MFSSVVVCAFYRCPSVFHDVPLQHPILWPLHVDTGPCASATGVFRPVQQPPQCRAHSLPQRGHAAVGGRPEWREQHAVGCQQRLLPLPETADGDAGMQLEWETLKELFQKQLRGNKRETGLSAYGLFRVHGYHLEPNWESRLVKTKHQDIANILICYGKGLVLVTMKWCSKYI